MARKLQFKRGNKAQMPVLAVGEPAFATDEGKLYLGDGTGNISIARGDHTHTAEQVTFTAASWLNGELAIPASQHGRTSANFVYSIRQQVGGSQVTNTWAILETGISYDAGTIRLKSTYAYAGEIIFSN